MITFVAVPFQLYSLTHSTLQVGLLSLCDAVPLILFAAIGGTIADRIDRRKVMLWSEVGLMGVSGLLALNAFSSSPQVWALYVLAAVGTSLWALGAPAFRALMPALVPPDQLAASQSLQSIYSSTGAIAGPAIGGVLIQAVGLGTTYAIDAASFGASLLAAFLIAPAPPVGKVTSRDARVVARGLAVPRPAEGDPRHLRPRHERDGVRDAAGIVPRGRRAALRRRRARGRPSVRGALGRRAARRVHVRLDRARPPAGDRRRGRRSSCGARRSPPSASRRRCGWGW